MLVLRDIQSRYRGTLLGLSWAVLHPLLMLGVYTLVFGGVFNARWTGQTSVMDFVLMLYCGLIVHALFSDTLTRSPNAVLANPNYVKKVVFPLELLPLSYVASATLNATVSLGVLCLMLLIQKHAIALTVLLVPFVLAPLVLLTAGLSWMLAAVGVFLRDVGQVIGVVMSIMLFLSPIFYSVSSVSPPIRGLLQLNPLTYPIEALRQVVIFGLLPDWLPWSSYVLASLACALLGMWVFQRTRPAFADVI